MTLATGAGTAADRIAAGLLQAFSDVIAGTGTSTLEIEENGVAIVISTAIVTGVGAGKHS